MGLPDLGGRVAPSEGSRGVAWGSLSAGMEVEAGVVGVADWAVGGNAAGWGGER